MFGLKKKPGRTSNLREQKRARREEWEAKHRSNVAASLAPLFDAACACGYWFYSRGSGVWFAPAELREAQARGAWLIEADGWELRDPQEKLDGLEEIAAAAVEKARAFRERMERE